MSNLFDSANYPETEPDALVIGDRWTWKRTDLTDYSTSLYTLKYTAQLEGAGTTEFDITASTSGNDYVVEVAASTTAGYTAGTYRWQAYIIRDSDSERFTIASGYWEVKPDWDTSTADPRTHAKIVLDAIQAVIEGRASKDQESYSIEGRSLSRTSIEDLLRLEGIYRSRVEAEQNKERVSRGLGSRTKVRQRFVQ